MHNQIMVDIETMGTSVGSVIVTIGACAFNFDTHSIGETFYTHINVKSSAQHGMKLDPDTVLWWMTQPEEARKDLVSRDAVALDTAMQRFNDYICKVRENAPLNKIGVWGNGCSFDNVMLEAAFKAVNMACPWSFWEHRDVRTLVWLGEERKFNPKKDMPFDGVKHNAMADAIHQAKYCMAIKALLDGKNIVETHC